MSTIPLAWILCALGGLIAGYALALLMNLAQQRRMAERFKALSNEALQNNNALFLDLAKSVLAREHEAAKEHVQQRESAVNDMLKPFQESLSRLEMQNRELEKTRIGAYEGLRQHLSGLVEVQQQLRAETMQLKQALRRPEGRGRWGEVQLRRLLEMAGMLEHCDFVEQESQATEQGTQRPDVIVKLPGGRQIVVDCKTPLDALLDAMEAPDEAAAAAQRLRHARQLRDHVKKLSSKAYWQQFEQSPDFVVMFLPGEHFLSIALMADPDLFDMAFQHRVIMASPLNLVGLLKTIAHNWRQERLAEDAGRIAKLGKELYEAMATLAAPLEGLGDALRKSVEHYNRAATAFENKALPRARRLRDEFGVQSDKVIEELGPLEVIPRPLSQPEEPMLLADSTAKPDEKKKDVA